RSFYVCSSDRTSCLLMRRDLDSDRPDQEKLNKNIVEIDRTVERISKIVQGLRVISRHDADGQATRERIGDVLDEVLELCAQRFKQGQVKVIRHAGPEKDALVLCERVALSQALLNLLNNAFDAVAEAPEKWVEVQLES